MGFLDSIGIESTLGSIGLVLVAIGGFMVLAGVGIISVQQVTVKQGRITWAVGLAMAAVGLVLLYPEFVEVTDLPASNVLVTTVTSATTAPTTAPSSGSTDWRTVAFSTPEDGHWRMTADGVYVAVGSEDTIAWSDEEFAGDLELTLDIQSPNASGAANILVFGDGHGLSAGTLIFTIANDLKAIVADTIYPGGTYLFDRFEALAFAGQTHSMTITIIDRKASLFLDSVLVSSVFLGENINSEGRIGLLKYWEIPEMVFSNIRVRTGTPAN